VTAGLAITGFGGALCQVRQCLVEFNAVLSLTRTQCAAFALPELLPNKWRHIGVVFADAVVYITVIVAPVTARYGWQDGSWYWNVSNMKGTAISET